MPNNTTIELSVSGNTKVLALFAASHLIPLVEPDPYTDETLHFDFNTIIPMPVLYKRNAFGMDGLYGGKYETKDEELKLTLLEKYGSQDWYDWCVANWGVKWNSYDNNINTSMGDPALFNDGVIHIEFQTAWTIPEGIFLELAELYPELIFEVECLEEGGGFAGYIRYEDGEVDETQLYTDIENWREQASKMLGYEFDENGDLI